MGNTFLLKNTLGQIAGFLVQKDTEIVYKFDPKTREETEIIFQFDDGTLEHKRIAFSGMEGSLHCVGKKIKGVAVTAPNEEVKNLSQALHQQHAAGRLAGGGEHIAQSRQ